MDSQTSTLSTPTQGARRPGPGWSLIVCVWVIQPLLLTLALFGAEAYVVEERALHLFWPTLGILIAFAFQFGPTALLPGTLAVFAVQWAILPGLWTVGLLSAASALAAGLAAWSLRRIGFDPRLGRIRDVVTLFVAILLAPLLPAVAASETAHRLGGVDFAAALPLCWVAGVAGTMVMAPLVFTGLAAAQRLPGMRWSVRFDPEAVLFLIATPVATFLIYAEMVPDHLAMPLSYAVFPVLILAALRRTPLLVSALLLLTGLIAFNCTLQGKGPFADVAGEPMDLFSLYAQYALLSLTALLLAAGRQERLEAEARARAHFRALERAGRINAMGTLAAGLAHELNQPLCALSSYASLARRQAENDPLALRQTLERIVRMAERASGIVARVRGVVTPGEAEAPSEQELNARIRDLTDLLRPEFQRRGIEVTLDLERTALPVRSRPADLHQLLTNPLQNAWEALAERPAGDRAIRIASRRVQGVPWAEVTIEDSGAGFQTDDREALFEPLVTGRKSGTGLGLAITRSIVNDLGGRVTVENAPGRGARVRIRLPLTDTGVSAQP